MQQIGIPGGWRAEHLEPYWAITNGIDDIGYIRTEEDARLVAVSPRLLEALRLLVRFMDAPESPMRAEARQAALASIAAATGEAQLTPAATDGRS